MVLPLPVNLVRVPASSEFGTNGQYLIMCYAADCPRGFALPVWH